jgi:hypothetical protein
MTVFDELWMIKNFIPSAYRREESLCFIEFKNIIIGIPRRIASWNDTSLLVIASTAGAKQ